MLEKYFLNNVLKNVFALHFKKCVINIFDILRKNVIVENIYHPRNVHPMGFNVGPRLRRRPNIKPPLGEFMG